MFGVVLWSDSVKNQAVIWCDDHGDLAFYKSDETRANPMGLKAGDLVKFDVADTGALRIASRPRIVEKESYPSLTGDLRKASASVGTLKGICESPVDAATDATGAEMANVVQFEPRRWDEVAGPEARYPFPILTRAAGRQRRSARYRTAQADA